MRLLVWCHLLVVLAGAVLRVKMVPRQFIRNEPRRRARASQRGASSQEGQVCLCVADKPVSDEYIHPCIGTRLTFLPVPFKC